VPAQGTRRSAVTMPCEGRVGEAGAIDPRSEAKRSERGDFAECRVM
jgi:hypothetical protein